MTAVKIISRPPWRCCGCIVGMYHDSEHCKKERRTKNKIKYNNKWKMNRIIVLNLAKIIYFVFLPVIWIFCSFILYSWSYIDDHIHFIAHTRSRDTKTCITYEFDLKGKGIRFIDLYLPKRSHDLPPLAGLYTQKPFQSPGGYSRVVGSI